MTHQIAFMRHGRSLLNDGYHSSERNNVLTWRGILATLAEAEPLKNAGVHRVLSSPIPRAYQTAMTAVGAIGRGVDITLHEELKELEPKDHDQVGYIDDEAAEKAWKKDIDLVPGWGLESQRMVYDRVVPFLQREIPPLLETGSILVVSHYVTLRAIRSWIERGTPDHIPEFRPKNSLPTIYAGADFLKRVNGAAGKSPIMPVRR